jgi:hypothetical protein
VSALRTIAEPLVVATPAGARVRTRLRVPDADAAVLRAAGEHLGSLASADLAARCAEGRLDAKGRAGSRRVCKQRSPRNRPPGLHLANRPDWRYLDASWKTPAIEPVTLDQARMGNVVSVDVNAGHLAMAVLDPHGNQIGVPRTIGLPLAGLPATPRDGHLRAAISHILHTAREHHAAAVVIENLDLGDARRQGGERTGNRPSKGRRGRAFRHQLTGIPTARFRDRLTHVACNAGLAVIAVDPAYASRWAAQHWPTPMRQHHPRLTGHHVGSVRDRQTRTRPPGSPPCVREPIRTRGCGQVNPGTPRD